MNYFIILFIIGLLILIHELGHFIFARLTGIPVARFSIGFGPAIWKWGKNETEYRISSIPIGGYILPAIEDEDEFFKIPVYKRILLAIGGPLANIILPIFIFALINISNSMFSFSGLFIEPFAQTLASLNRILHAIPLLFTQPEQLSGIVGIVAQGGQFIDSNIQRAINISIILSLNLAVFNMLPFPVLDGGKIFLYLLEKIHPKLLKLHLPLAIAGWILIFGLMIYATINDVVKLIA